MALPLAKVAATFLAEFVRSLVRGLRADRKAEQLEEATPRGMTHKDVAHQQAQIRTATTARPPPLPDSDRLPK